jgi:hypothetical protein
MIDIKYKIVGDHLEKPGDYFLLQEDMTEKVMQETVASLKYISSQNSKTVMSSIRSIKVYQIASFGGNTREFLWQEHEFQVIIPDKQGPTIWICE